jgi:hypothetical protein
MGEGKKQPIDEIRWEEKFEHNKIVFKYLNKLIILNNFIMLFY